MIRFPDWQTRLDAFLRQQKDRTFEWGKWDCCLFVADAITAMTGEDPAQSLRGKYNSEDGAKSLVGEVQSHVAVGDIVECLAAEYKMPEIPITRIHRGDMILFNHKRGTTLGLVGLDGISVIAVTDKGVAKIPLAMISADARAWAVGVRA